MSRLAEYPTNTTALVLCAISILMLVCLVPALAAAQETTDADEELTRSMGFPPLWKPYGGVMAVWDREVESNHQVGGELDFGVYRDLDHPVNGLLGFALEGYGQGIAGDIDGGVRAMIGSRSLLLHVGADYSIGDKKFRPIATLTFPLWRGGVFGGGADFRFGWVLGRDPSFSLGLNIPLWQSRMGRTRPDHDYVNLPKSPELRAPDYQPGAELAETIADLRETGGWINLFTAPFLDQEIRSHEKHLEILDSGAAEFKAYMSSKD